MYAVSTFSTPEWCRSCRLRQSITGGRDRWFSVYRIPVWWRGRCGLEGRTVSLLVLVWRPYVGKGAQRQTPHGVEVHIRHVIDDHGDPATLKIAQDMIQKCGFSRTRKAGKHGDG